MVLRFIESAGRRIVMSSGAATRLLQEAKLQPDRNFSDSRSEAPAESALSRENLGSDPNLGGEPLIFHGHSTANHGHKVTGSQGHRVRSFIIIY